MRVVFAKMFTCIYLFNWVLIHQYRSYDNVPVVIMDFPNTLFIQDRHLVEPPVFHIDYFRHWQSWAVDSDGMVTASNLYQHSKCKIITYYSEVPIIRPIMVKSGLKSEQV